MNERMAISKERMEDILKREMTPDEEFIFNWAWMDGKIDGVVTDFITKHPPGGSTL